MDRKLDDVAALYSHVGLDPGAYKTFRQKGRPRQKPEPDARSHATIPALNGLVDPVRTLRAGDGAGEATYGEIANRPDRAAWSALNSIFETAGDEPADTDSDAIVLPGKTVSLFGCAGGVGVTSLVATLSRTLSLQGQKVLAVDGTERSILPYYFGAQSEVHGWSTFLPGRNSEESALYAFSRCDSTPEELEQSIMRGIRESRASLDRLVFGAWSDATMQTMRALSTQSICVAVVVPDLHAVLGLRHLERSFRNLTSASESKHPLYVLLNRFDASVPLHVEMRARLARQLGDRLLPFSIRRSDAIAEALARFSTVMDYAPNSGIAEDFLNVAQWLESLATVTVRAKATSAGR